MDKPVNAKAGQTLSLSLSFRLDQEETFVCLKCAEKHKRKTTRWVQTAILLVMLAYLLVAFFLGGMKTPSSLMLALVSLLALGVLWFVPSWHLRLQAQALVENSPGIRLHLHDGYISLEGKERESFEYDQCRAYLCMDILVLEIGENPVGIPRRVTGDEDFLRLLQAFGKESVSDLNG